VKSPVVIISAPETSLVAPANGSSHSDAHSSSSYHSSSSEEYSYLHFSEREHERSLLKGDYVLEADEQREPERAKDATRKIGNERHKRQENEQRFLQVVQDMENARARECQRLEEQLARLQQAREKDAEVRPVLPCFAKCSMRHTASGCSMCFLFYHLV